MTALGKGAIIGYEKYPTSNEMDISMNSLTNLNQKNPVRQYINGLNAPSSKRTMQSALRSVVALALDTEPGSHLDETVETFPWHTIDVARLTTLRAKLLEAHKRPYAAKLFIAVRGVLGACFDLEMIDADTWARLQRVKNISSQRDTPAGRRLTAKEVKALMVACLADPSPAGQRDDAIIALGLTCGLRISEVAKLNLDDYDPETSTLSILGGKGDKDRNVRTYNSTRESLDAWIALRGDDPGPLFCPILKNGRILAGEGVSSVAITKMIYRRAEEAKVARFSFHDLRRSFATSAWEKGIPGPDIQKVMGHADISTTARYDRGSEERALRAMSAVDR